MRRRPARMNSRVLEVMPNTRDPRAHGATPCCRLRRPQTPARFKSRQGAHQRTSGAGYPPPPPHAPTTTPRMCHAACPEWRLPRFHAGAGAGRASRAGLQARATEGVWDGKRRLRAAADGPAGIELGKWGLPGPGPGGRGAGRDSGRRRGGAGRAPVARNAASARKWR